MPSPQDSTLLSQPAQPSLGLLSFLEGNGSIFAYGAQPTTPTNGTTPSINPLATNQSKLHAYGQGEGQPGYSYDGSNLTEILPQFNEYNDGDLNVLPDPTKLDLNDPVGVPGLPPSYNSTNNYLNKAKSLQNEEIPNYP